MIKARPGSNTERLDNLMGRAAKLTIVRSPDRPTSTKTSTVLIHVNKLSPVSLLNVNYRNSTPKEAGGGGKCEVGGGGG